MIFDAYTARGYVAFPDREVKPDERYTYARLRGYSFILGVWEDGKPIGWCQTPADETATEFMEKHASQRNLMFDRKDDE